MVAIRAIGTGPVAFTDGNGAHQLVPLSAIAFDNGAITVSGVSADVAKWVGYLAGQQLLTADTSGAAAPAGPAFLVEAQHPGAAGNSIALKISGVTAQAPPATSTFTLEIDVAYTVPSLKVGTIVATIGTSVDRGNQPGLLFLATAVAPSGQMPTAAVVSVTGSPPRAQFMDAANNPAVTLEAPGDGGGAGTFTAEIVVTGLDTFDLKVKWSKSVTNKTVADHASAFQYVVKISQPPGGYGVPKAETFTLAGGADATSVSPTPAKASADPA